MDAPVRHTGSPHCVVHKRVWERSCAPPQGPDQTLQLPQLPHTEGTAAHIRKAGNTYAHSAENYGKLHKQCAYVCIYFLLQQTLPLKRLVPTQNTPPQLGDG